MHHDDEQEPDRQGHDHHSQEEAVVESGGREDGDRHVEQPDPDIGESAKTNPAEGVDPERPHGT